MNSQKKDGKEDGPWTEWHKNGQKEFEGHFIDGVENGERIEYSIFGTVKFRGNFVDGVQR